MNAALIPALERLAVKASTAEDCLERALDAMEAGPGSTDWHYVHRQVDLAHDRVIDITSTCAAFLAAWLEALTVSRSAG